jgi:hypothetical protein
MFMSIEPEEVIPHLLLANLHCTFNLLDNWRCYHHTHFYVCQLQELYHCLDLPVSLTISTIQDKAYSEEVFIVTLTKLATGIWLRYLVQLQTPLSPACTKPQWSYLTIRLNTALGAFAPSVCGDDKEQVK